MRTYGTAKLKGNTWCVLAEPHVAIRLRRVFKKAGRQIGVVRLAATEEVCRDLLWFAQRYPLEFDPQEVLEERAESFDRRTETFAALLDGKIEPRRFDLAIPPRHYQQVAAELALQAGGLLIADDVGLGKTCTAIAALSDPATRPALVVTLTHLPRQWEHEIKRFAPTLRTHIVKKGTPYDITQKKRRSMDSTQMALLGANDMAPTFPDVLLCNYHKLAGWAEALAGKVRTVIFDECQELRRGNSQKYDAAKHIADACNYKIGLSATPIYNYGIEFFNVMQALRPGILGSRSEFLEEWCKGYYDPDKAKIADPKAFGTYVRDAGVMIRRTRQDVGRELPPLSKSVIHVDSDERKLEQLTRSVGELAKLILEKGGAWEERGRASRELDWRMRQATGIAKAPYVADFVKLLVESGERVVLYGWHREVYSIWMDRLKDYHPVLFTGSESPKQKHESKVAFCEGQAKVLIMSLRAGAGLDGLQGQCRNVVFGELDWSPGVHEQAVGRVHRDGQEEPVVSYFLVSDEGSDPVVMDVLGLKREQVEGIRNPTADLLERLETGEDRIKKLAAAYLEKAGKNDSGVA